LKTWLEDCSLSHELFASTIELLEKFAFRSALTGKRADAGEAKLRELSQNFKGDFVGLWKELEGMRTWWNMPSLVKANFDDPGFYDRGSLGTYVLWRYENHLRAQRGRQFPLLLWKDVLEPASGGARFAKDHIEPKHSNNPRHSELVVWNEVKGAPRPFGELYLHRLGNLVLDTIAAGVAKNDSLFPDRIEHYLNSDFASQREIVVKFASIDDGNRIWDCTAIRRRHEELVQFAINYL
jgi:hypothetical protein